MRRFTQGSVVNPAAGADFTFTPSNTDSWRLVILRAKLVTSAVVANRFPHFQVTDTSGTVVHEITVVAAQTATQTITYQLTSDNGAPFQGGAVVDGVSGISLPAIYFPAGYSVKTVTTAKDAGDQWSGLVWAALVGDEWEHLSVLEQIAANLGG